MENYQAQLVGRYADVHKRLVNGVVPSKPKKPAIVIPIRQDTEGADYPSRLEAQLLSLKLSEPQAKKIISIFAEFIQGYVEKPAMTPRIVSIEQIIDFVCAEEKITRNELAADRRYNRARWARHIVCYLCWEFTKASFRTIGHFLGDRDHTTILNARNRVAHRRQIDSQFNVKLIRYEQGIAENYGGELDDRIKELQFTLKKH